MLDLAAAELLVVGAVRAWVEVRLRPRQDTPDWREILALGGIAPFGAMALEMLLGAIAGHATRPVEVRACACRRLGADERQLIALVALIQAGDWSGAAMALRGWLPSASLPSALRALECFACALSDGGHRLHARAAGRPAAPGTASGSTLPGWAEVHQGSA